MSTPLVDVSAFNRPSSGSRVLHALVNTLHLWSNYTIIIYLRDDGTRIVWIADRRAHWILGSVSSLYTNIPHEEGITACEEYLNRRELQEPPTADLCELIRLVLTKNSFVFNKTNYLQIHGTAMGTRMAPSYANLFMGKLEREFLRTQDKILYLEFGGGILMTSSPYGTMVNHLYESS